MPRKPARRRHRHHAKGKRDQLCNLLHKLAGRKKWQRIRQRQQQWIAALGRPNVAAAENYTRKIAVTADLVIANEGVVAGVGKCCSTCQQQNELRERCRLGGAQPPQPLGEVRSNCKLRPRPQQDPAGSQQQQHHPN